MQKWIPVYVGQSNRVLYLHYWLKQPSAQSTKENWVWKWGPRHWCGIPQIPLCICVRIQRYRIQDTENRLITYRDRRTGPSLNPNNWRTRGRCSRTRLHSIRGGGCSRARAKSHILFFKGFYLFCSFHTFIIKIHSNFTHSPRPLSCFFIACLPTWGAERGTELGPAILRASALPSPNWAPLTHIMHLRGSRTL